MKSLIVKEDGLIYAAEVPEIVQPSFTEYEGVIESVKESSVLCADQEKAKRLLFPFAKHKINASFGEWESGGMNPGIYPIPDLDWTMKEEVIGVLSGASPFGSVSEFRKVAILKESTPSKSKNMKYRKKPVVIDAIQWLGDRNELREWEQQVSNGSPLSTLVIGIDDVRIITLEGKMSVSIGDYIIRGVVGEFYPCKPDIFKKTYELVESTPSTEQETLEDYLKRNKDKHEFRLVINSDGKGYIHAFGQDSETLDFQL